MTLYAFRWPEDEFPPLGLDRGDKSIYFDEYTEHCHWADWNWCAHCGEGSSSTHNPQWRRREHFEEEHQRDVRRAERRAARLSAADMQGKRRTPTWNTPARRCAASDCDEVILAGSNPRQTYHDEACKKRSKRVTKVSGSTGNGDPTGVLPRPGQMGVLHARIRGSFVTAGSTQSAHFATVCG